MLIISWLKILRNVITYKKSRLNFTINTIRSLCIYFFYSDSLFFSV